MKNFKKWLATWWITCASLLILAACGGSFETAASRFSATLSGNEVVPPSGSTATGTGVVTVNPDSRLLAATVNTTNITGTSAHIHEAATGQNGPVIIPLTQTAPGSGVWVAAATLTEAQITSLRAGNWYFEVHSDAFPNGEIRGQIRPDQFGGSTTTSSGGSTTTSSGGSTTTTSAGGTTTTTAAGGTTTSSVLGTTTSSSAATTTSSAATTSSTAATTTTLSGGVTTTTAAGGVTTTTAPGGVTTTTAPGGVTSSTLFPGVTTSTIAGATTTVGAVTTTTGMPVASIFTGG